MHTETIRQCFDRYIRDTSDLTGNTGPLPGKGITLTKCRITSIPIFIPNKKKKHIKYTFSRKIT